MRTHARTAHARAWRHRVDIVCTSNGCGECQSRIAQRRRMFLSAMTTFNVGLVFFDAISLCSCGSRSSSQRITTSLLYGWMITMFFRSAQGTHTLTHTHTHTHIVRSYVKSHIEIRVSYVYCCLQMHNTGIIRKKYVDLERIQWPMMRRCRSVTL